MIINASNSVSIRAGYTADKARDNEETRKLVTSIIVADIIAPLMDDLQRFHKRSHGLLFPRNTREFVDGLSGRSNSFFVSRTIVRKCSPPVHSFFARP